MKTSEPGHSDKTSSKKPSRPRGSLMSRKKVHKLTPEEEAWLESIEYGTSDDLPKSIDSGKSKKSK